MECFRSLEPPERRPDAFSARRSALESRGQSSRLSLANIDGPVQPARAKIGARLDLVATSFRGARHLAQVEIRRGD